MPGMHKRLSSEGAMYRLATRRAGGVVCAELGAVGVRRRSDAAAHAHFMYTEQNAWLAHGSEVRLWPP